MSALRTIAAPDATPLRPGHLGIGELPRLPADLLYLRALAGDLRFLARKEKNPRLAAYMSRTSDRVMAKSERFILTDPDGVILFGGRQWSDPLKAAEHAAHEMGGDISDDGYAVKMRDGRDVVVLAEVVELEA